MKKSKNNRTTLSNTELASFCRQTALILKAGISPLEGVEIMLDDSTVKEEIALLEKLKDSLMTLGVFSIALSDAGVFPEYMLQMTKLGEQAGRLDEVMQSLADHYEREAAITTSIRSAVLYPSIMIGMMLLVVIVLITKVLPIFNQVFAQFGRKMSGVSLTLMDIGKALSRYSTFFIGIIVIIIGLLLFLFRTEKGRKIGGRLLSKVKFTKTFYHKNAASRFASGMSLSLKSGLTTEEGIEMSSRLTTNPDFLLKIENLSGRIKDGGNFPEALKAAGIFTGMHARMITVADKTGSLDEAMEDIAKSYTDEMDDTVQNAISVLEPTLVAALSIIVGLILLSVMMPLLGILSGI